MYKNHFSPRAEETHLSYVDFSSRMHNVDLDIRAFWGAREPAEHPGVLFDVHQYQDWSMCVNSSRCLYPQ